MDTKVKDILKEKQTIEQAVQDLANSDISSLNKEERNDVIQQLDELIDQFKKLKK